MCHMKSKVLEVLNLLLSFYTRLRKKGLNMLTLMLDPIYKSMRLVTIYVGHNNVIVLVVEYD
jgi:hypothetical protein